MQTLRLWFVLLLAGALGTAHAAERTLGLHASAASVVVARDAPGPSRSVTLTIGGLSAGEYRVQWFSTSDGSVIRSDQARGGTDGLRLTAPDFIGDIACKVARVRPRT